MSKTTETLDIDCRMTNYLLFEVKKYMLNKDVNEMFGDFKYMIPCSQTIQITLSGMILPKGNLISFQVWMLEVTILIYDKIWLY